MNKYDHLSYSSISKFIACPAQFNFYMNNKKALPTESALAGKERHEEIAKHLTLGSIDQSKFGVRMKGFCRYILKTPEALEHEFALDFITNTVIGKIDAYSICGKQAVIVDWKNYPGYDNELQLKIYAMAVKELHPEVEVIHAYFFFSSPDYYEPYTYFTEELNCFSTELAQTIDAISTTEKFEPRPGPHCSRCSYVEICPVAKNFEIVQIDSVEAVIELAKKTYAVESLLDKAKENIKNWIVEHGLESLPVGKDSRYYLSSSTSFRSGKFKTDKDREACNKALELVTGNKAGKNESKRQEVSSSYSPDLNSTSHYPVSSVAEHNQTISSAQGPVTSIVAFTPTTGSKEKIRMMDLAELMKKAGLMKEDASTTTASNLIRDRLGTNFIMATDDQKAELKADLEAMINKKSA